MTISHKREHHQIALNHSSDIEIKEPFSLLVNYATLPSHNPLRIWNNLL